MNRVHTAHNFRTPWHHCQPVPTVFARKCFEKVLWKTLFSSMELFSLQQSNQARQCGDLLIARLSSLQNKNTLSGGIRKVRRQPRVSLALMWRKFLRGPFVDHDTVSLYLSISPARGHMTNIGPWTYVESAHFMFDLTLYGTSERLLSYARPFIRPNRSEREVTEQKKLNGNGNWHDMSWCDHLWSL